MAYFEILSRIFPRAEKNICGLFWNTFPALSQGLRETFVVCFEILSRIFPRTEESNENSRAYNRSPGRDLSEDLQNRKPEC
jgi:hypothetical protein